MPSPPLQPEPSAAPLSAVASPDPSLPSHPAPTTPSTSPSITKPSTPAELRALLTCAWTLESYTALPTPRSRTQKPIYPMTKHCQGMLLYTADGYLSAQLSIPGQAPFNIASASQEEWAEAGRRYVAYTGGYYVTEEEEEEGEEEEAGDTGEEGQEEEKQGKKKILRLRHEMRLANLPQSRGSVQVRRWRFEDEGRVLVLGGNEATEIRVRAPDGDDERGRISLTKMEGEWRIPELRWRRLGDNSEGVPPV